MEISQDEGVNDFLQRIKELGDKRNREDNERNRKLEEEILAGRQARQARRAERAKSLSPTKESPAGHSRGSGVVLLEDIPKLEPDQDIKREDALQDALERLTGRPGTSGSATESSPATTSLPWQRRLNTDRNSATDDEIESPQSQLDVEFKRSEISRNLGSKDISFFNQSSDRKVSSDALRKDAEQQMGGSTKTPLPGMAHFRGLGNGRRDSTGSAEPMNLELSKEPQRPFSASGPGTSRPNFGSVRLNPTSVSQEFILDDQARQPAMSPSQVRMSPERERTPSPTKGFGSFVQSAMLKRESSISKRWNPNAGGSISRNNSTAVSRDLPPLVNTREPVRSALSRESSPAQDDRPTKAESPDRDRSTFNHNRARAKSIVGSLSGYSTSGVSPMRSETSTPVKKDVTPPTSPPKTYDQKRWSPTKASWLEVALKKGTEGSPTSLKNTPTMDIPVKELPPKAPTKPLTYSKPATLASKSITDTPPFLRSPSPSPAPKPIPAEKPVSLGKAITLTPTSTKTAPPVSDKPIGIGSRPVPGPKGQLDFRGNLKPRNSPGTSPEREELPFLNAMSRLRSTRTQNYVAPNELKDQILAGKANLQLSGGPQKTQLPDPLKETITTAKVALKHSSTAITPSEVVEKPKPPLPKKQASAPGRLEIEKPSVVNRVPNLANLLSRGPIGINAPRNISNTTTSSGYSSGIPEEREDKSGDVPLTHMTKGRAKGPRRRQPTKAASSNGGPETLKSITPRRVPSATPKRVPSINHELNKTAPVTPPKPVAFGMKPLKSEYPVALVDDEPEKVETKVKPPTPAKSPLLFAKTDFKNRSRDTTPIPSPSIEESTQQFVLDAPVNNTPPAISISNAPAQPAGPRTLGWLNRRPTPNTQTTSREIMTSEDSSRNNKPSEDDDIVGELNLRPSLHQPPVLKAPVPGEVLEYLKPSRISGGPSPVSPIVRKVSVGTLADNTGELNSFFGKTEAGLIEDLDVTRFLSLQSETKIEVETEKTDVWEVTGEGKVQTAPSGEEHIMFDESMYLVLHHYIESFGEKATEIFLWRGNSASTATFDDAEHFAQKMADESDAKLIFLQQGRETPEFLHAIGGVIVTRRGASRSKGALPYMLCARNYAGGVAFDEEELQSSFLCSGFPFLIHSQDHLYLWKGKGSSADELDAARSMAMVLSSGSFEEIDEGQEPNALLEILKGQEERASAEYWQLKPAYKNYAVRLFRFDQQSDSKVTEISPFCQSDLDNTNIYVLDAFFEIYIVIGANSQPRKTEFQTALQFAHEYAKNSAPSGRPYIPPTFVLLGGVSREFRAVFRSWQQKHIPTTWTPSRKPSLRIVGLEEARRAMNMCS